MGSLYHKIEFGIGDIVLARGDLINWLNDYTLIYLLMIRLFALLLLIGVFLKSQKFPFSVYTQKNSSIPSSTLSIALNFKSEESSLNSGSILQSM